MEMDRLVKPLLCLSIAGLLFFSLGDTTLPSSESSTGKLLPRLLSVPDIEREKLAKEYENKIALDVTDLVDFLGDRSNNLKQRAIAENSAEMTAVRLLGELRHEEAAPILFEMLELRDDSFPINSNELIPQFPHFPCAIALTKIGAPVIPRLLRNVKDDDENSLRFQLSCLTLRSIVGERIAVDAIRTLEDQEKAFKASPKESMAIKIVQIDPNRWDAVLCKDFHP